MPQIKADVFPAIVRITASDDSGFREVYTARAIVTESKIVIALDGPEGPKTAFSQDYDPASFVKPDKRTGTYELTTALGQRITFHKDDACGCGSRLRSWNPFKGNIMSSKNPTE